MEDVATRRDAVGVQPLYTPPFCPWVALLRLICGGGKSWRFTASLAFQLLSRRNALHERAMYRRAQLADSFHLQQFFRDSDELKSWVNEKMKTATDEAYKVMSC